MRAYFFKKRMKAALETADTLIPPLFTAWGNSKYSSGAGGTPGGGAPFWLVNRELLEVTNLLDLFPQTNLFKLLNQTGKKNF